MTDAAEASTRPRGAAVGRAQGDLAGPWVRYGWVIQSVWLVFLFFPLSAVLGARLGPWATALGVLLVVAFAAVYTLGMRRLRPFDGSATPAPLAGPLYLAALVGITVATTPLIGIDAVSFMPFLVAFAMFALRLFLGVAFGVLAVYLTGWWVLARATGSGLWVVVFTTLAVAVMTLGSRLLGEQVVRHDRTTRELALVEERERVARDVHDVLGHSLTVVTVKAELAERLVAIDPARATAELVEIQALARQALAEIRETVGGLRVASLVDELETARMALAGAGIEATVPADPAAVDPRHRTVLAWVLREAVTNVVRHSDADSCVIEIGRELLRVSDDGRGLEKRREGNGLRGARERVAAAGGTLTVSTGGQGYGTVLEVRL